MCSVAEIPMEKDPVAKCLMEKYLMAMPVVVPGHARLCSVIYPQLLPRDLVAARYPWRQQIRLCPPQQYPPGIRLPLSQSALPSSQHSTAAILCHPAALQPHMRPDPSVLQAVLLLPPPLLPPSLLLLLLSVQLLVVLLLLQAALFLLLKAVLLLLQPLLPLPLMLLLAASPALSPAVPVPAKQGEG